MLNIYYKQYYIHIYSYSYKKKIIFMLLINPFSLLPIVGLAGISVVFTLQGSLIGILICITAIAWCAFSATRLFNAALDLHDMRLLVGYPCFLIYGVFALLTIF